MEPMDVMDSGRMAVFADPEGAAIMRLAGQPAQGRAGSQRARGLNFNSLNTRDAEGAKAFYGAVFGWKVLDRGRLQRGRCPDTATTRRTNPGLRKDMAEMGAPEGFNDVVATIDRSRTTSPTPRRTGA